MISKFIHLESNRSILNDNNCLDSRFMLNEPMQRIKKITLKSMELPVSFPNIRENSTNIFTFIFNSISYSIVLLEKNYTSINELLDNMNARLQTFIGSTLIFLLNTSNQVYIKFTGTLPISFSIIDNNLSRFVLGFRSGLDRIDNNVDGSRFYTAINRSNINCDNFITIMISNLNYTNGHTNQSTFKVPFNAQMNQIFYYNELMNYTQFVSNIDIRQVMMFLNVKILDRFGVQLKSTIDYSMSLLIESEI